MAAIENIAVEKNLLPAGVTALVNAGRDLMAVVQNANDFLMDTLFPKTAAGDGLARSTRMDTPGPMISALLQSIIALELLKSRRTCAKF